MNIDRKTFLASSAALSFGSILTSNLFGSMNATGEYKPKVKTNTPNYLKDFENLYKDVPHQANLRWFQDAGFGLFMTYGLYSLLERGEWVQLFDKIPLEEYKQLTNRFKADNFDAGFITDLALSAGMKYVNITAKHHDGFCLWPSQYTDYHVGNTPAGRDLIGELAKACDKKGLGFFVYYSLAADWHHPYFYPPEEGWEHARPNYKVYPAQYKYQKAEDFQHYIEFASNQVKELLNKYEPVAGVWFDPIWGFYQRPDLFPMREIYSMIRSTSPYALISFKQGATGMEDYASPEHEADALVGEDLSVAQMAQQMNECKPKEVITSMQIKEEGLPIGSIWGYNKALDGKHRRPDNILELNQKARADNNNLLLNVGPKPDGSFPEEDVKALTKVGKYL